MIIVKQTLKEYKSINIQETHPSYVEGADITAGEIYLWKKYLWKAVESGTEIEPPMLGSPSWVKWGISNKYAAIDEVSGTVTYCNSETEAPGVAPYDLVMEFDWNRQDFLAISDAVAKDIRVEISRNADYSNPVLDYTFNGETRPMGASWYDYFYSPVGRSNKAVGFSLRTPTLIGFCRITLSQSSLHPSSSVGIVFAGRSYFVGCTKFPFTTGLEDFSKKETDEFGTTSITKRRSRKVRKITTIVKRTEVINIEGYIKDNVLGNSVLFVGDESDTSEFKGLITLGFVEDFSVPVASSDSAYIDFDIKEIL